MNKSNIRVVPIENGFVNFSPSLKLPVKPMIGTIGAAPKTGAIKNSYGGRHGGNMDVQEARAGAMITLPIEVPGAPLHIGDGEINGSGGIECRALLKLLVEIVSRPTQSECVRIENRDELRAIAREGGIETCAVTAIWEPLRWICADYGLDEPYAYLLLGQVMTMRILQLVNPARTVMASVRKCYLLPG